MTSPTVRVRLASDGRRVVIHVWDGSSQMPVGASIKTGHAPRCADSLCDPCNGDWDQADRYHALARALDAVATRPGGEK